MPQPSFTIAYWCIFVAVLLPIACTAIAKFGAGRRRVRDGGYDNRDPRGWLARQQGAPARANAAQANSFEALPFFIAAVLIAHQLGAPQGTLDVLAVLFIVLRVAYIASYVAGRATLRSLVWALAFAVNAAIFFLGWR